jgi:hypothetical protein
MATKQRSSIETLRALTTRFNRAQDNLDDATTMIDVCQFYAEGMTCIDLLSTLDLTVPQFDEDFEYDATWNMRNRLDATMTRKRQTLQAEGKGVVCLDASTPAALSATLARLREWMREHEVAHVTIMPKDVATMGVDADTASQRMWDAAPKVITEERFEASIVTKVPAVTLSQWRVISLGNGVTADEPKHSQGGVFHFACNKYATADDFIRAHQKDNSPEEWYVIAPAPMAPRGWDVAETDHD